MDLIITPLQASSDIACVFRLSSAALRVRSSLIWSWISVVSAYSVRFNASWVVLESPVRSGFLPKNGLTVTVTGLLFFSGVKKLDLTAMDRLRSEERRVGK